MGAYQPLEMNARPPILDAMAQVSQSLGQLGDQRHQQALEAQARKRQEHADFVSAYTVFKKLADSGDHAGAAAVMQRFKGRYGESPTALPTPAPPAQQQRQGTPQGGSPMPDQMEFPRMPQEEGPDGVGPDGRPVQPPIDPGFVDSLPMGAPPPPGPQAPNPLMAAAQAPPPPSAAQHLLATNEAAKAKDQQRNQQRHNILYFTPPGEGGQEMSYDPQAVREQHLQQRTAEIEAMVAKAPPEVKAVYAELAPILAMDDKSDASDIVRMIGQRMTSKRADDAAAYREKHDAEVLGVRKQTTADRIKASWDNTNAAGAWKVKAAEAYNNSPLRQSTAATAVSSRFDSEWKDFRGQVNWRSLQTADRALKHALKAVASGNPLGEQEAKVMYAKFARGTTPTEGEMHLLYKNMGGLLANGPDKFVEKAIRGGLTDKEREIVGEAVQESENEMAHQIAGVYDSARAKFGPGSGHENMQGNVNANVASLLGPGFPPVFESTDGPVPTVTLGEGNPMVDPKARRAAAEKKRGKAPGPATAPAAKAGKVDWSKRYDELAGGAK